MIRRYWHEETAKVFTYSYPEKQVRRFPEGQLRLKKSERLSKKGARRAKGK